MDTIRTGLPLTDMQGRSCLNIRKGSSVVTYIKSKVTGILPSSEVVGKEKKLPDLIYETGFSISMAKTTLHAWSFVLDGRKSFVPSTEMLFYSLI